MDVIGYYFIPNYSQVSGELVCGQYEGLWQGKLLELYFVFYNGAVYRLPLPNVDSWNDPFVDGNDTCQFILFAVKNEVVAYGFYLNKDIIDADGNIIQEVGIYQYSFILTTKEIYFAIHPL